MDNYGGIYRGLIADANDPEQRKRYRVRVVNVHRDEVPVEALPWAEWCTFGGKGFGDIAHFEVGDAVFVMFEGGSPRFPVIMGGWLSYAGGTGDLPSELTGDYATTQQRWMRLDRAGNFIRMSPLPNELFVEIQSADARVTVRGVDGTIEIVSDTKVVVRSPVVQVQEATEVSVETQKLVAQVSDEATLQCSGVVNIRGETTINIGKYQPPTSALPPPPETTDTVNVEANTLIKAESLQAIDVDAGTTITVDAQGDITVRTPANLIVEGTAKVEVKSDGPVEVTASEMTVTTDTAKLVINVKTDCEINVEGDAKMDVGGSVEMDVGEDASIDAAGNVEIDAAGNATVSCAGSGEMRSAGPLTLHSDAKIDITAPLIDVKADSLLNMESDGVTTVDGGTIFIGGS